MVIGDLFHPANGVHRPLIKSEGPYRASSVARISSFSIDLIFLLPLLNVVFVPFQKMGQQAVYLDQEPLARFYLFTGMMALAATYIVATAIISRIAGGTLGQRLLGLAVKSIQGDKPSLPTFLVRQTGFCLSTGLMFLPFLSAISSRDHRTWIDRITNTYVESSSPKFAARWNEGGAHWAKFCSIMIVATGFVIGLSLIGHEYKNAIEASGLKTTMGCEVLTGVETNERLVEGLTLYASGQIDDHCLDQEANWALARQGSLPLIYLAKSFSKSKTDLSDKYLNQVCQEVSASKPREEQQACEFSVLIQDWNKWLERENPEKRVKTLLQIGSDYALVWGARQFFSRSWWKDTLLLLEPLSENISISEFVQSHKVRSLWSLGEKDRVRQLFADTAGLWGEAPRRILAESICAYDLEQLDCGAAQAPGCQFYLKSVQEKTQLNKKESALALQILSCPSQMSLALSSQWQDKIHMDLVPLWKAVKHLHLGDAQKARLLLSGSARESSDESLLKDLEEDLRRAPSSDKGEAR
jgi:uncharacterized RDD family membrane protein YckC